MDSTSPRVPGEMPSPGSRQSSRKSRIEEVREDLRNSRRVPSASWVTVKKGADNSMRPAGERTSESLSAARSVSDAADGKVWRSISISLL